MRRVKWRRWAVAAFVVPGLLGCNLPSRTSEADPTPSPVASAAPAEAAEPGARPRPVGENSARHHEAVPAMSPACNARGGAIDVEALDDQQPTPHVRVRDTKALLPVTNLYACDSPQCEIKAGTVHYLVPDNNYREAELSAPVTVTVVLRWTQLTLRWALVRWRTPDGQHHFGKLLNIC